MINSNEEEIRRRTERLVNTLNRNVELNIFLTRIIGQEGELMVHKLLLGLFPNPNTKAGGSRDFFLMPMMEAGDRTPFVQALEKASIPDKTRKLAQEAMLTDIPELRERSEEGLLRDGRPSVAAVIGVDTESHQIIVDLYFASGFSPDTALNLLRESIQNRRSDRG